MPKQTDKELGLFFKNARHEQKLTYEELAEKAEMSSRYLKEIENGGRVPSFHKIRKLVRALNVPPEPLFYPNNHTDNLDVLDQIKAVDLEEYEEFLKVYKSADSSKTETNGERGVKRKISALRSFYAYYYRHEMITTNPSVLIDVPKIHDKNIIRLDTDEVAMLLDYIEHCGDTLTGQKRMYHEKTKDRDLAIVTLLLGTGIRVSECVGLDVEDVDFKNNGIKVTRKGGNEMVVYFGPEVEKALKKYLEVRENITPLAGHEHALFYSTQRRRIGVQAIENLVKKYAREITTTKKITPHKLRSTYGTALYQETGDIYLVADVLGHKDVNTTKKHYAALDDARRRQAAKAVRLRED